MAVLRFRVYWEEDEMVYRDVEIRHKQNFLQLLHIALQSFEFDTKHQATFYRSNDYWQRGREISIEKYDKEYKAPPLIMSDTVISTEINDPSQKFILEYDFAKHWTFHVQLIKITKEEDPTQVYPNVCRKEGLGPQQYGTKSLLGEKFNEIEEKYDLSETQDGFGEEGEGVEANKEEE
jgi:hypothetical protein